MNRPFPSARHLRRSTAVGAAAVVVAAADLVPAEAALPDTTSPALALHHLVRTHPFTGSTVSMRDDEGSAYVARDHSLWLCDDIGRTLYEVDPTTGALKRTIPQSALMAVTRFGGGASAGRLRTQDIEGLSYDAGTDTLYAFSGIGSTQDQLPTAFRFTRVGGRLQPADFQPLPAGTDYGAAAWNPADQRTYVGFQGTLRSYDYRTNTTGPDITVPNLVGILGMEFTPDGKDLFVARTHQRLSRVSWAGKSMVPGWTFDLSPYGVRDARAVALVGDRLFVSDGLDTRAATDPMNHAVFAFDVTVPGAPVQAPVAAFRASATSGRTPVTVSFTDESRNHPTGWVWSFGDGGYSSERNPTHVFRRSGTFTVTLTVSNSAGGSTATTTVRSVDVTAPAVSVRIPAQRTSVAAWARVVGRATDAGSGVRHVLVHAVEQRGRAWYAYQGATRGWVRAGSKATALARSREIQVVPTRSAWSMRLARLTRGRLVLRVAARDRAGNLSAVRVVDQRLTRR